LIDKKLIYRISKREWAALISLLSIINHLVAIIDLNITLSTIKEYNRGRLEDSIKTGGIILYLNHLIPNFI